MSDTASLPSSVSAVASNKSLKLRALWDFSCGRGCYEKTYSEIRRGYAYASIEVLCQTSESVSESESESASESESESVSASGSALLDQMFRGVPGRGVTLHRAQRGGWDRRAEMG